MLNTSILIIDDNHLDLKKMSEALNRESDKFEIYTSIDVFRAIKIANKTDIDLIICDWQMPKISGIEAIEILKKQPNLSEVPIIIVSGIMIDDKNLSFALNKGAADFVRKPIIGVELVARAKNVLRTINFYQDKIEAEKKAAQLEKEKLEEKNKKLSYILFEFERKNKALLSIKKKLGSLFNTIVDADKYVKDIENIVENELNSEKDREIFNLHLESHNIKLIEKLKNQFPDLTDYDLRLCTYIKFNISNHQIAEILNVELSSIHTAKNRLRKKLGLENANQLAKFLEKY